MTFSRCIDCDRDFERGWDEQWKIRCIRCWRKRRDRQDTDAARRPSCVPSPPTPIPPDIMRVLIQLVHPDRHGNSAASNRATAWLLSLRNREKAAE